MKRRDFLAFLFFLLAFLFPGICLASKLLGYTLLVHSGRHFAVLSTLLYGILGILLLHREEKTAGAVSVPLFESNQCPACHLLYRRLPRGLLIHSLDGPVCSDRKRVCGAQAAESALLCAGRFSDSPDPSFPAIHWLRRENDACL